jgi:hypothetical protein
MTNSTDVFQPEYERLSLPAQSVIVFVNGEPCDDLEPIEFVRNGWPEFDLVRLGTRSGAHTLHEQIASRFSPGTPLGIRQSYNADPPQQTIRSVPIFLGQIESIETALGDESDTVEILARDFSAVLERITVYGQRVRQSDGSTVLLPGLQTIFNPTGQGNAAVRPTTVAGRTRWLFSSCASENRLWTCAEAIAYLLSEYLPNDISCWPDATQLEALSGSVPLRDLDVTGMTLLEAVHRCAQCADLSFRFVPLSTEGNPGPAVVFHQTSTTRCVELNTQSPGQSLSISRTNVAGIQSTRPFHPVTCRTIGRGDFKTYEATFELVKAWDPTQESTNYARFSATTNDRFSEVKDVYRKWCLNEAGDYTAPPFNQGEPFDFSRVFEGAAFVHQRRRFWPALSTDDQGKSAGYFLEVSFDGVNWWQYFQPFNNLLDECGIWLSGQQLDVNTWVAALKGVLRFRITAAVISDERLTCMTTDGPVGSTAPVVDHVLTLPRQFKYRKVSPQSIFWQAGRSSDQVDDTRVLYDFVRRQATLSLPTIETIQVRTPSLWLHLHPGDRVTSSPDSRDWLSGRRDNRSFAQVEQVRMDFRHQCTDLRIIRQRQ